MKMKYVFVVGADCYYNGELFDTLFSQGFETEDEAKAQKAEWEAQQEKAETEIKADNLPITYHEKYWIAQVPMV